MSLLWSAEVKQVNMHQLHRAKAQDICSWLPFDIVSDGQVLAHVLWPEKKQYQTLQQAADAVTRNNRILEGRLDHPDNLGDSVKVRGK